MCVFFKLFIYFYLSIMYLAEPVLDAAPKIVRLRCCVRDLFFFSLQLRHVESSSLTRVQTWAPCTGTRES